MSSNRRINSINTAMCFNSDYTIKSLAKELNCSARKVNMMINNGDFPGCYKIGNRRRIPAEAVERYKAANEIVPTPVYLAPVRKNQVDADAFAYTPGVKLIP